MLRLIFASLFYAVVGAFSAAACTGPSATLVDEIYPSGADVPENLLRFYIYFTGPMSEDEILPSLSLTRSDGSEVQGAFLSNRFELWSPDRTRLTLLLDPGRVKTGLAANAAFGRALRAGEDYRLTIARTAKDALGCTLANGFSHDFAAVRSDVEPPDPGLWAIDVPRVDTRDPLRLDLGSPHDHLSMAFRIQVLHEGTVIPGHIRLAPSEAVWLFTPRNPWANEAYSIAIGQELEDLAGNRPGKLFDHPLGLDLAPPVLRLEFTPASE